MAIKKKTAAIGTALVATAAMAGTAAIASLPLTGHSDAPQTVYSEAYDTTTLKPLGIEATGNSVGPKLDGAPVSLDVVLSNPNAYDAKVVTITAKLDQASHDKGFRLTEYPGAFAGNVVVKDGGKEATFTRVANGPWGPIAKGTTFADWNQVPVAGLQLVHVNGVDQTGALAANISYTLSATTAS